MTPLFNCLFLGYAANHAGNAYRMLKLKTNKVLITRDVRWSKKVDSEEIVQRIYYEINLDDGDYQGTEIVDDSQAETIGARINEPESDVIDADINEEVNVRDRPRIAPEVRRLQAFNNLGRMEIKGDNAHSCFFVPASI